MKTYFNLFVVISTLVGTIGCATSGQKVPVSVVEEESSATESKGRWVADKGNVKNTTTPPTTSSTTAKNSVATVEKPGFQKEPVYTPAPIPQDSVVQVQRKPGFLARFFGPSQPMMIDAISQSSLPANPVRRSESSLILPTMHGTINYSHSQGTRVYAERSWGYNGPREVVDFSTHNYTSFNFTPETTRRWIAPTYYQQYQGPQGTVTWP